MVDRRRYSIEADIRIRLSVAEVFKFYSDFRNLPLFLGDVVKIDVIGPASTRWTIRGPLRTRIHWTVKITEIRKNELIRYQTCTSMLRTYWEICFTTTDDSRETEVREKMRTPFGKFGLTALTLIGKFPAKEISANLNRLKEYMETGKVTDMSYAVKGKFIDQNK